MSVTELHSRQLAESMDAELRLQRNLGYQRPTVKLDLDFWLGRELTPLTPMLFKGQLYFYVVTYLVLYNAVLWLHVGVLSCQKVFRSLNVFPSYIIFSYEPSGLWGWLQIWYFSLLLRSKDWGANGYFPFAPQSLSNPRTKSLCCWVQSGAQDKLPCNTPIKKGKSLSKTWKQALFTNDLLLVQKPYKGCLS